MALTYRYFRNKNTGELVSMPAGRYGNFLNTVKKLVNYVQYNIPRYYVVHLTLTVAENVSEVDFKHLHRVIQFIHLRLKRSSSDFKYVAVKEAQARGAVHYHVLCIYSKPYVFPESKDIAKSWGLGFVKLTAPKLRLKVHKIASYIGKYIGKGYEYEALDYRKSFTASQIKQIFKLSSSRLTEVVQRYGFEALGYLKCTYRKIFVEGINEETKKREKVLLYEFPSEWEYLGVQGDPF